MFRSVMNLASKGVRGASKNIIANTKSNNCAHMMQAKCMASSLVSKFEESVEKLPMREAVRYTSIQNGKWTATELKSKIDAHANGLLDIGVTSGDTIAVWLNECPERHVTLLAAAKAGLKVADMDCDSITTVPQLREALALAKCKVIVFHPTTETHSHLMLLRKAIPEFYHWEDEYGQWFHSKHFPELKFFIQTGFDQENGCLNYKYIKLPANAYSSLVDGTAASTKDDTPLYFKITGGDKVLASSVSTHAGVLKDGTWPFLPKFIANEYFEV